MQLGRGVAGAGQRSAAKARGPHPEVAAIFLDQHVRGDLRRAEEAVQAPIDRHVLADAVRVGVVRVDLPSRLELPQRERVRQVAVDLVGRREDEHRLGGVDPRGFEQVHRAHRVDVEVGERLLGRPVMGGLGRGVDHELDRGPEITEDRLDPVAVPDVHRVVAVAGAERLLEPVSIPRRRGLGAEEDPSHVVVDAHDVEPELPEVRHRLGSDQAGGSGDHRCAQPAAPAPSPFAGTTS